MGQKANPIVLRLGLNKQWQSNWYSEANYAKYLQQDFALREFILKRSGNAGVSRIDIERPGDNVKINIHSSRPGLLVGRRGSELDKLKKALTEKFKIKVQINVKEVRKAETDAMLIATNIASQIERRMAFRRVIKKTMQNAMRFSIGGCKIMVGGRLNGAEIARSEWIREGRVPLHTFKADIDYATYEANTVYGLIGIKVWVYKIPINFNRHKKHLVHTP
ncbi:MAG: 30S ribosomal protein S3 [SAR324 cluster bacterium]|nr:30S ribosomal protein S3 [SAR324 cluster bacterium]